MSLELYPPISIASRILTLDSWENGLVPFVHMPKYFEEYGRKEPQNRPLISIRA